MREERRCADRDPHPSHRWGRDLWCPGLDLRAMTNDEAQAYARRLIVTARAAEENPLVTAAAEQPEPCGVTRLVGGKEWVCVASAHDAPPREGHGQRSEQPSMYGYSPRSERHYFRRRWPNSDH